MKRTFCALTLLASVVVHAASPSIEDLANGATAAGRVVQFGGPVIQTNANTGARTVLAMDGHMTSVDQFGTMLSSGTNWFSWTMTNGMGIGMTNDTLTIASNGVFRGAWNVQELDVNEIVSSNIVGRTLTGALTNEQGSPVMFRTNLPLVNVKYFGAVGDGITDDSTAIQSAANYAAAVINTLYFPPGNFKTTTGLSFLCSVASDPNATIYTTYAGGAAITIGDLVNPIYRPVIDLPSLVQNNRQWSAGTFGSDIGIKIGSIYTGIFRIHWVRNFSVAIKVVSAPGYGFGYNKVFMGHLDNCLEALDLMPVDHTAWVNQNQWIGGRYSADSNEGTNISKMRRIKLVGFTDSSVNGNSFIGGSVEGDGPEYHVDLTNANWNLFQMLRYETSLESPKVLLGGAITEHNMFDNGEGVDGVIVTEMGSPSQNCVRNMNGSQIIESAGTDGNPTLRLRNAYGETSPVIQVVSPGVSILGPLLPTNYTYKLSGTGNYFKKSDDAYPRVQIKHATGELLFGDGTFDPATGGGADIVGGSPGQLWFETTTNLLFYPDGSTDIGSGSGGLDRPNNLWLAGQLRLPDDSASDDGKQQVVFGSVPGYCMGIGYSWGGNTVAHIDNTWSSASSEIDFRIGGSNATENVARFIGTQGNMYLKGTLWVTNGIHGNVSQTTNSVVTQAADYNVQATDTIVLLSAAHSATLPTAVGIPGKTFTIKCTSSGTNAILTTSSQTIDGFAKWTNTAANKFVRVISDNANWWVVGSN